MFDELRERVNEAGRLFSFRQEQLAVSNFSLLYKVIRYSGIIYMVLLVVHFISNLYRIPLSDAALVPVFLVFFKVTDVLKEKRELTFSQVRLLAVAYYLCFMVGISVIDLFPVAEEESIRLFPMLLIIFSVYYMDRLLVILLAEAAYIAAYLLLALASGQLTVLLVESSLLAYMISIVIYWSVLGIYTEERRDNRMLEEKSSTDGLTGLLNKVSCEEEIRHYLDNRKEGAACALLVLDFDNFKHVNDAYGHQIGDDALKKFGDILRRNFRTSDILGRMGGDEFMVLAREPVTEELLIKKCNSILMELATARFGEAKGFSCSIGVAMDPEGYSFEGLYHTADDALYEAKARGKAQYVLWTTKKIVPTEKRAIYIASPKRERREAIKKICGPAYLYYEGENATQSFNEISLYSERHLESIYFDYEQPDIAVEQIREFMESRPLYAVLPVHDVELELKKSHIAY